MKLNCNLKTLFAYIKWWACAEKVARTVFFKVKCRD